MSETFSITIAATPEQVWRVLWDDATFRDWAAIIDEGSSMEGELVEGQTVHFMSSIGGYGVRSLVTKLVPHQYVSFRQVQDTKEFGTEVRDTEWTGADECYELTVADGVTTLTLTMDVPPTQEATMATRVPHALARIKELAEVTSSL